MKEFKMYINKDYPDWMQEMRPYIPGEDTSDIYVNPDSNLNEVGMLAGTPVDPKHTWYMDKKYFENIFLESWFPFEEKELV